MDENKTLTSEGDSSFGSSTSIPFTTPASSPCEDLNVQQEYNSDIESNNITIKNKFTNGYKKSNSVELFDFATTDDTLDSNSSHRSNSSHSVESQVIPIETFANCHDSNLYSSSRLAPSAYRTVLTHGRQLTTSKTNDEDLEVVQASVEEPVSVPSSEHPVSRSLKKPCGNSELSFVTTKKNNSFGNEKNDVILGEKQQLSLRSSGSPSLPSLKSFSSSTFPPRAFTHYRSRWDYNAGNSYPVCNPKWLTKMQKRLPWYNITLKSGGGPWLSARAWETPYQLFTKELRCRWHNPGDRWFLLARTLLMAILIFTLLMINVVTRGDFYEIADVPVIYDWFQSVTSRLNLWVNDDITAFSVLIFIASFLMDLVFLLICLQWVILGDSFRLPIAYGLLYGLRAVLRLICIFPFPEGYVWHAPTFGSVKIPSLTVPYQPSDDFFFSGHVACCMLAIIEHYYYRCWWGFFFSITVSIIQFWVMIITRGHYAIDMIIGIIIAHWLHILSRSVTRPIDQWLGLPPRPTILKTLTKTSTSVITVAAEVKQIVSFTDPSASIPIEPSLPLSKEESGSIIKQSILIKNDSPRLEDDAASSSLSENILLNSISIPIQVVTEHDVSI